MKSAFIATLLSMTVLIPSLSQARDTVHMLPFDTIVQKMTTENKLDGSVKFYLAGNTPSGKRVLQSGLVSNKKTNSFNKTDEEACNWALESALLSFQDSAKKAGANSVINIVSYYKKSEHSDKYNYECHAGALMAGTALKGDLAN